MKEQLLKVMQRNQLVEMMYIAKNGEITKRRIKVTKVLEDKFNAYCFLKRANRVFCIDNVLALVPVIRKEREVI
ncbi:transcriptional regulator [Lysinibacillus halotolerans]|uniref:transcriptional regulator n=1 Tax=Ureibacillus sp. FSL E2-3493 TaxID=2921367 RepID=UPI003119CB4B